MGEQELRRARERERWQIPFGYTYEQRLRLVRTDIILYRTVNKGRVASWTGGLGVGEHLYEHKTKYRTYYRKYDIWEIELRKVYGEMWIGFDCPKGHTNVEILGQYEESSYAGQGYVDFQAMWALPTPTGSGVIVENTWTLEFKLQVFSNAEHHALVEAEGAAIEVTDARFSGIEGGLDVGD